MLIALIASLPAWALDLEVSRLEPGQDVTFTVSGGPASGTAWVMASTRAGVVGPCAPSDPSVCSDLAQPVVLTPIFLDGTGAGVAVLPAPASLGPEVYLFQAVTNAPADTSPVQAVPVVVTVPAGTTWVVDTQAEWRTMSRHVWAIAGDVIVRDLSRPVMVFQALERIDGTLSIEDNAVERLWMTQLERTPDTPCTLTALTIRRNPRLTFARIGLQTGSVCSEGNGPVHYELPHYTDAFMLQFQSEGRADAPPTDVASLDAPLLASAVFLDVYYTRLDTLSLPSLVQTLAPFQLWHNDLLTVLDLPAFTTTPQWIVRDNMALSSCEVDDVAGPNGLMPFMVSCQDVDLDPACLGYCS